MDIINIVSKCEAPHGHTRLFAYITKNSYTNAGKNGHAARRRQYYNITRKVFHLQLGSTQIPILAVILFLLLHT